MPNRDRTGPTAGSQGPRDGSGGGKGGGENKEPHKYIGNLGLSESKWEVRIGVSFPISYVLY